MPGYPLCTERGASGGSETSQYPEEKKSTEIPRVVANERGGAQTLIAKWAGTLSYWGVVRHGVEITGSPIE